MSELLGQPCNRQAFYKLSRSYSKLVDNFGQAVQEHNLLTDFLQAVRSAAGKDAAQSAPVESLLVIPL